MNTTDRFTVLDAKTGKEISLAMEELWLKGKIMPVGAHLLVFHNFRSDENRPLELVYSFGLPRDAALRRFSVRGDGFRVRSELKPVAEAKQAYEKGIQEGHLSTLAQQYRDGLVNLTIGNVRPGESVTVILELLAGVETSDNGVRFRFPFTLAPCYHAKARMVEAEPGVGELELPDDEFGDLLLPRFVADASGLHRVGFDLSIWMPSPVKGVASPSHAIEVQNDDPQTFKVRLAPECDVPNRDLVLDIKTQEPLTGVLGGVGKDRKSHFAALVPSSQFGQRTKAPRRVVFTLDRSGSMQGIPLAQARKALEACLGVLSDNDQFNIIAFDNQVKTFRPKMVEATRSNLDQARGFLEAIEAGGGTELAKALTEAVTLLRRDEGDVFLITDGQVYGTEAIVRLAKGTETCIHCLGIGSASQDRFLTLLARETGGTSRFVTPRERVDIPAVDLFANAARPVAADVRIQFKDLPGAKAEPAAPTRVFPGIPLIVFAEADGTSTGQMEVDWEGENGRQRIQVPVAISNQPHAETIRLLRGARLITDLESRMVGTEESNQRNTRDVKELEHLSVKYGLASRAMSLVAVVERVGDQGGAIPQTRVIPVGMPQDTAFGAYFEGAGAHAFLGSGYVSASAESYEVAQEVGFSALRQSLRAFRPARQQELFESAQWELPEDLLLELASRLEPDGGMRGGDDEQRLSLTLVALLCFLAEGHTVQCGTFRSHVERLLKFVKNYPTAKLSDDQRKILSAIIALVESGRSLPGNWFLTAKAFLEKRPPTSGELWKRLQNEIEKNAYA